jgi:hypothetical protein
MEEISLEEFISSLDESYRIVFELLEDQTLIHFAKNMVPIMKAKGLTAETILFDEEIKAQMDTIIDGNADKLIALEALLTGEEYLEKFLESIDARESVPGLEDAAAKMVTYQMIQYILSKKSRKNVQ